MVARGYVQLSEDLAQVVLHCAGADEQLGADLGVGQAVSGQPGDLPFLGRERVARVHDAPARGPAGRQQLAVGTPGERLGPGTAEHVVCGSKVLPSVDAAVLATQPLTVRQVCAGEMDDDTTAREPFDRLAVEGFGCLAVAQQGA